MTKIQQKSVNTRPLLEETDTETENEDYTCENRQRNDDCYLFKASEPSDKYHAAYIIFYLLGIITLIPWNFFITADDYWMYKFRDPNAKRMHPNITLNLSKRTPLQAEFTSYLSVASNIPSIAFLALNAALNNRISLQCRMVGSLLFMLILFIITTVFVKINTDSWQKEFFIITMCIVVLLNMSSAVLSGSIFGIIGKFSPKYITAVVGGQALGGIFAALAQILSLTIGASSVHSAFVYFMVGNCMLVVCLIAYLSLSRSVFFKYFISERTGIGTNHLQGELVRPRIICYRTILRKIWTYGLSIFLVFAVSLCVYPGVTVLIESEGKGKGNKWNDIYFVPVVAYLLFSCGDYLGRVLAGIIQKPKRGWLLIVFNLLRIIFIPLILLCNAQPRHSLPVIFNRDYYYILIILAFSLSNGYLANLPVIFTSRVVENYEKESASSLIAVFLGMGLTLGSAISLILVKLL